MRALGSAGAIRRPLLLRAPLPKSTSTSTSTSKALVVAYHHHAFTSRASSPSSSSGMAATGTGLLYHSTHRGRPASNEMIAFMEELRKGAGHGSVELRRSGRDDRVLELVLRNERSRNSLTGKMMVQLHDIAGELTSPASQYEGCCALILRGEGSTFCSGADFHLAAKIASPVQGLLMAELMTGTLTRLRRAPLVTVACLGNALGGGAELSTAADFRVMRVGSKVQFVQARMGVSCGWGGTSRLVRVRGGWVHFKSSDRSSNRRPFASQPQFKASATIPFNIKPLPNSLASQPQFNQKLVGRRRALQLLGGALPLDAAAAEEAGFVDLVCEEGEDLEHAAWRLLYPFLRHTTEALRSIKMGVAAADDLEWDRARDVETDAFRLTWGSEANKHALQSARARIASASVSTSASAGKAKAKGKKKE